MASWIYPFKGSFPVTETFAQGDPGTDWGMPVGTPIYAIASGTVTQVGLSGYGNQAPVIDHGNGIQSYYGHVSKSLVAVGQQVIQGQMIALSGNEGISTGPHLELGIIVHGQHVDPQAFLASQGAGFPSGSSDSVTATPVSNPITDWVTHGVASIFKPLIDYMVDAGLVAGGSVLILYGFWLIARDTGTVGRGATVSPRLLSKAL